jgi:hypothetical protein
MRLHIAKFCFSPGHDRAQNRLSNVIAALKQLFAVVSRSNIHLSLHHIPSRFNLADTPSRRFSLLDSMLSSDTWVQVQGHFDGPSGHSVDLMALPSNVQHASSGHPLPFFSPVPSAGASGVNVFSQLPHHHPFFHNPYAFLPIILIPKLFHFFPAMVLLVRWLSLMYILASFGGHYCSDFRLLVWLRVAPKALFCPQRNMGFP